MAMNYINMSSENQTFYGKDMEPGVVQSVPGPINANDFLQISKAPDADVPDAGGAAGSGGGQQRGREL